MWMIRWQFITETEGCEEQRDPFGISANQLKEAGRLFRKLRTILVLLTRLSAGCFNLVIIFRPQPDIPVERQIQMIPANTVDKFKGLKTANSSLTEVDLPANVRQQNNNSWNGRVVYWLSKTNMINWLLCVLTAVLKINLSTASSKKQLMSLYHACMWC